MRLAIAVIIFLTFFAQASLAEIAMPKAKMDNLQERLKNLEEQQKQMEAWYTNYYLLGKGRISPFLNNKINVGGYFETGVSRLSGPDMQTQTASNNAAFGLNLTAEYSEKIRFVVQTLTAMATPLFNQHNNPNLTPSKRQYSGLVFGSLVAQGYLEYRPSEYFNIQSGVGYIPFGIAFQQREPVLFHKRGGPQMLVNDDGTGVGIAAALWSGLHFYGQFPLVKANTGYNFYTFTPASNVSTLGIGGRLWWLVNEYIKTGVSFQSGKKRQTSYLSQGLDVEFTYNNFGLISEYAISENSNNHLAVETYYIEPYYKFSEDHWLVYVNIEYLKSPLKIDSATQIADPIEKRYYGTGINWLPLPTVRFRLGYLKHDYIKEADSINGQKRDYTQVEFSTAIAF